MEGIKGRSTVVRYDIIVDKLFIQSRSMHLIGYSFIELFFYSHCFRYSITVLNRNVQTTESARPSGPSGSSGSGYSFFGFGSTVKEPVDSGLKLK